MNAKLCSSVFHRVPSDLDENWEAARLRDPHQSSIKQLGGMEDLSGVKQIFMSHAVSLLKGQGWPPSAMRWAGCWRRMVGCQKAFQRGFPRSRDLFGIRHTATRFQPSLLPPSIRYQVRDLNESSRPNSRPGPIQQKEDTLLS